MTESPTTHTCNTRRTFLVGVGMTPFLKPGSHSRDYPDLAREATTKALMDARLRYPDVEQAYVGYCYGDSTAGQRALYELGLTAVPVVNVNNNCATGATALWLARQAVRHGAADCALAVGFERMQRGPLSSVYQDRANPLEPCLTALGQLDPDAGPVTAQIFARAGMEHGRLYGTTADDMARIAQKNHAHGVLNPYAQSRRAHTLAEVRGSPRVSGPLTRLQCCPTSDGAAAVIVASEAFVRRHGLEEQAVEVVGQGMATDSAALVSPDAGPLAAAGVAMTRAAARRAFAEAGVTAAEVQVVELHDCFSANELVTYDALGLCPPGQAGALIDAVQLTSTRRADKRVLVVNPSGGLLSKGHPLGATGLAQATELAWQVRGVCGPRQVSRVRYALQHNIGLGGAAVVTVYARYQPPMQDVDPAAQLLRTFRYNPAVECRPVSPEDVSLVAAPVRFTTYSSKL